MKYLIAIAVLVLTIAVPAVAQDFGDHNCRLFVMTAENVSTAGAGNHYMIAVAVSKALLVRDFKKAQVTAHYQKGNGAWETKVLEYVHDLGALGIFGGPLDFGVTDPSEVLNLTASVYNGIDRLYDNNVGGDIQLNSKNNWRYAAACK